MAMALPAVRRIATYERVSSEDQRERETIKTQTEQLARSLAREPDVELVERFVDEGVSGTIPLAERPAGSRLMRAAAAARIDEIHVYKFDRLGRDEIDLLVVRRRLNDLGIRLISVVEGEPNELGYGVQAIVSADGRRQFLQLSARGMERAAREGRYCGGIVPLGYRVAGERHTARLVPDETIHWQDLTAAGLVRRIYEWLGLDGWSCVRVARELNLLGVPTHYARDDRLVTVRGERKERTQGIWRSGRIRNLVVNPVYRGDLQFGRRIDQRSDRSEKRGHEIISAAVQRLVSPELWGAAQDTLARNRTIAKNTRRRYLLRGVIRCATCGLTYVGSQGRGAVGWYRCGGQLVERGPHSGRCPNPSVRTDTLGPIVWADIERFLRDPGDVLDELDGHAEREAQGAIAEAQSITLVRALEDLDEQRQRALALAIRGRLSDAELDAELDRMAGQRTELEARMAAMEAPRDEEPPQLAIDLLDEVRARLDAGLTIEQRQEIVRLLVRIVIHADETADGRKSARIHVEYRFPAVVETRTGTDSSRPRAGSGPASPPRRPRVRSQSGLPRVAGEVPRVRRGRIPAARRGTGHRDDTACVNVTLRHRPIVAKVRRSPCRPEATTRRDSSACRAVEMTNQVGLGAATK
jgi:site-specific DNA recombinase